MVVRKEDGVYGVGGMVKAELFETVVELRMISDRVMAVVLAFEDMF